MKNDIYRILSVLTVLVLISLACSLGSKKGTDEQTNDSSVNVTQENQEEEPEVDLPELGEERRSEEGGYAYRVIPDFKVESSIGITSMVAPDGSYEAGPLVMIIGGVKDEGSTTESVYKNMKASSTAITFSNERKIKIDGHPGIAVDFSGTLGGEQILGSMAIAVTELQQISILANAPKEQWENELAPLFEAVVKSIRLFEPAAEAVMTEPVMEVMPTEVAAAEPTPIAVDQPKAKMMRQWAKTAFASSEYTNEDWSANQATGAPNTSSCEDSKTAWASVSADGKEWLELYYVDFVIPTEVNIHISYAPNQVVLVELLGASGNVYEVYKKNPHNTDICPFILSIPVNTVNEEVGGVRITVDQSFHSSWNEIDAVELVGLIPDTPASASQPTLDADVDYRIFTFSQTPLSQVAAGKFHCEIVRGEEAMITLPDPETLVNVYDVEYQFIASTYKPNIFISIFLPKNYQQGQVYVTEYASAKPGEQMTATVAIDQDLYMAYDGWMYVTEKDGKFTGGILFLSVKPNETSPVVETRCIFNQISK